MLYEMHSDGFDREHSFPVTTAALEFARPKRQRCKQRNLHGQEDQDAFEHRQRAGTARMHERMASEEGKAHYRRRKTLPEPVFGWIKNVLGIVRVSARGLERVQAEWQLICAVMNLRRMHALGWKPT